MPIPAYAKIDGIEGSSKVSGREGMVEILEFHHNTYIPTEPKAGVPSGTARFEPILLVKNYDKASPKLYEAVWKGKTIPKIEIHWYQINDEGIETEYFTHTLTKVKVLSVKAWMPHVDDKRYESFKHMEEVGLRPEKMDVLFVDGNIEATYSFAEERA
jgi:type VI secretion system secreted protein Hcp